MRFKLFIQRSSPFCKHFERLYYKYIPGGERETLPDDDPEPWIENRIDFVPTVVVYKNGREVDRLDAVKMVGIRKKIWVRWLERLKDDYGVDYTKPVG